MPNKMWDTVFHPIPNFDGSTVEVWERMINFNPHFLIEVIPIFPNSVLNAASWAHCMCHHELGPASVSPFSFPNIPGREKTLPENYLPYLKTFSSKFCSSMLLFLYSVRLRRPLMEMDVEINTVRERLINVITHSLIIYSPWLLPYLW